MKVATNTSKDSNSLFGVLEPSTPIPSDSKDLANADCPVQCSANGTCVEYDGNYMCQCDLMYTGSDCSVSLCDVLGNCHGNGKCLMPSKPSKERMKSLQAEVLAIATELSTGKRSDRKHDDLGCKCNDGFQGIRCGERICTEKCVHGTCLDGTCECDIGYKGKTCEEAACGKGGGCSGHGNCVKGECICDSGYEGVDCSRGNLGCPMYKGVQCGGHGYCDEETLTCWCSDNFLPPHCGLKGCEGGCSGHGVCMGNDVCKCDKRWSGDKCDKSSTMECFQISGLLDNRTGCPSCSGKGYCNDKNLCECDNGYGGYDCSLELCPNACTSEEHGTCGSDGLCKCKLGWTGKACEESTCSIPHDLCGKNGKCDENGKNCRCNAPWAGKHCTYRICPGRFGVQCSGHGTCNDGTCECEEGFHGSICSTRGCPTSLKGSVCSGHGTCTGVDEAECVCLGGYHPPPFQLVKLYGGDDCSKKLCPTTNGIECDGFGSCKDGKCQCNDGSGRTGAACHIDEGAENAKSGCAEHSDCNFPNGICSDGTCFCEHGTMWGLNCQMNASGNIQHVLKGAKPHVKDDWAAQMQDDEDLEDEEAELAEKEMVNEVKQQQIEYFQKEIVKMLFSSTDKEEGNICDVSQTGISTLIPDQDPEKEFPDCYATFRIDSGADFVANLADACTCLDALPANVRIKTASCRLTEDSKFQLEQVYSELCEAVNENFPEPVEDALELEKRRMETTAKIAAGMTPVKGDSVQSTLSASTSDDFLDETNSVDVDNKSAALNQGGGIHSGKTAPLCDLDLLRKETEGFFQTKKSCSSIFDLEHIDWTDLKANHIAQKNCDCYNLIDPAVIKRYGDCRLHKNSTYTMLAISELVCPLNWQYSKDDMEDVLKMNDELKKKAKSDDTDKETNGEDEMEKKVIDGKNTLIAKHSELIQKKKDLKKLSEDISVLQAEVDTNPSEEVILEKKKLEDSRDSLKNEIIRNENEAEKALESVFDESQKVGN
eukprot:g2052.t1